MLEKLTAPEFTRLFTIYTNLITTTALKVSTAYALCREVNDEELNEIIAAAKTAAEEMTAAYTAALDQRGEYISENETMILKASLCDAALTETNKLINKAAKEITERSSRRQTRHTPPNLTA